MSLSRKKALIICTTVAALLLVWGCGSDKSTSNPTSDPANLDQVEVLVGDDLYGGAIQALDLSLILLDSVPAPQAPENKSTTGFAPFTASAEDDDIVINAVSSYVYQNNWHIFEFGGEVVSADGLDTFALSGIDSVKVLTNGDPLGPGSDFSQADQVITYAHFEWTASGEVTLSATGDHRVDISLDEAGADTTILVDGTVAEDFNANFSDTSGSCTMSMEVAGVLNNLSITSSTPDCPNSGSVTMDVALDFHCLSTGDNPEAVDIVANVTVSALANGESVTVTYTDGVNAKTVTENCDGVVASPWRFPEL